MLLTLYKLTRINFCSEILMGQLTWLQNDGIVCFGNIFVVGDILYEWLLHVTLRHLTLKVVTVCIYTLRSHLLLNMI